MIIKLTTDPGEIDECAHLMYSSDPFTTLKFDHKRCLASFEGDYKEVYLAYINDEIAGFVVLQLVGPLRGYIQTICLKPEFRNRGIGTSLLKFSEERLFKISPNVFICVSSFNHNAQRLYASLGFEKIGIVTDMFVEGYDEYILRKTTGSYSNFTSGT